MVRLIASSTSLRVANDGFAGLSSPLRHRRGALRLGRRCAVLVAALAFCLLARGASAQTLAHRILSVDVENVGAEEADVEAAIARLNSNDVEGAIELLKRAREKNRALAPANVLLGRILGVSGKAAATRNAFERAVKEDPTEPEPYLVFGQLALGSGRVTDAELLFQKTISMAVSFTGSGKRKRRFQIGAYSGLASIAERRQQWDVAEKHLNDWIRVDSDKGNAHRRLGIALFRQEKTTEAYTALKAAKDVDGQQPAAEVVMSSLYTQDNDDANAQKWLDEALKKNPTDTSTRLAVIGRLLETGNAAKAIVQADAVYKEEQAKAKSDPTYKEGTTALQTKILRGIASRMQNKHENAEAWLTAAHRQAPVNFTATNHLVLALVAQEDKAKKDLAMQYARINAQLFPYVAQRPTRDGLESYVTLAWVFYETGKPKEATQILNTVRQQIGQSPSGSYYVARLLFNNSRAKEAGQMLEAALKTKRLFVERTEAEKLLKRIKAEAKE